MAKLMRLVALFAFAASTITAARSGAPPNDIINFNDPTAHLTVLLENKVGPGGGFDWTVRDSTFASLLIQVGTCKGNLDDESSFVSSYIENVTCPPSNTTTITGSNNTKHCVTVQVLPNVVAEAFAFSSNGVRSEGGNRHVHINIEGTVLASYFGLRHLENCRGSDVPINNNSRDVDEEILHNKACVAFTMPSASATTGTPSFAGNSMLSFDLIDATYVPTAVVTHQLVAAFRILSYKIEAANAISTGGIFWHRAIRVIRGEEDSKSPLPSSRHQSMAIGGRFSGGVSDSQFTLTEMVDVFPLFEGGRFTDGTKIIVGRVEGTLGDDEGAASRLPPVLNGPAVHGYFTDSTVKIYKVKTRTVTIGDWRQQWRSTYTASNVSVFAYTALEDAASYDTKEGINGVLFHNLQLSAFSNASVYDSPTFNGGQIGIEKVQLGSGSAFSVEENKNVSFVDLRYITMMSCDRASASCGVFVQHNSFFTLRGNSIIADDSLLLINNNVGVRAHEPPRNARDIPSMRFEGESAGNGSISIMNNDGIVIPFIRTAFFSGPIELWNNKDDKDPDFNFSTLVSFDYGAPFPSALQISGAESPVHLIGTPLGSEDTTAKILSRVDFGCAEVAYGSSPISVVPFPGGAPTPCVAGNTLARCSTADKAHQPLSFDDSSLFDTRQDVEGSSVQPCVAVDRTIPPWQGTRQSDKSRSSGDSAAANNDADASDSSLAPPPKPPRHVGGAAARRHSGPPPKKSIRLR